jgi:hypothetical protein
MPLESFLLRQTYSLASRVHVAGYRRLEHCVEVILHQTYGSAMLSLARRGFLWESHW